MVTSVIHPSAVISPSASIGEKVKIGPFCIVGPGVRLGDGVELKSHVVIEGHTTIGDGTIIYPFASIGQPPQDLKYKGEASEVIIGRNNIIREYVTIQPGTAGGGMLTSVGDNGLFMVGVHIAHDCKVGNKVVFANYVSLAGHVEVGDYVVIGGLSAVHQHVRIGQHAMIGGVSAVVRDLIPFGLASSERASLEGLNLVGMKRRGFSKHEMLEATKIVDELFSESGLLSERVEYVQKNYHENSIITLILEFLKSGSSRAFCLPKR